MKLQVLLLLFIGSLLTSCSAQLAEKVQVRGVYIQEYTYSSIHKRFCVGASLLLTEGDTLYLFSTRSTNSNIISTNPKLYQILGNPNDYITPDTDSLPQFDLKDNRFNYHRYSQNGWIVDSEQFYKYQNSSSIFTCFNVEGEIVKYSGVDYLKRKEAELNHDAECNCGNRVLKHYKVDKFGVVSSIGVVSPMTPQQIIKHNLQKVTPLSVSLFYCE